MQRDKGVNFSLKENGFTIFRFWENEIKKDLQAFLNIVLKHLDANKLI
ncbi:very short patch repair endonuclease [Gillisia sp. JM1]|nr:very short patch repair endonuclease [Gillisia sp. JM1]